MNPEQSKAEDQNGLGRQTSPSSGKPLRTTLKLKMRDLSIQKDDESCDDPETSNDQPPGAEYEAWLREYVRKPDAKIASAKCFLNVLRREEERSTNGEVVNFQGKCKFGANHALFVGKCSHLPLTEGYSWVWCDGSKFRFTGSQHIIPLKRLDIVDEFETSFSGPLRTDWEGHLNGEFKIGSSAVNMSGLFKHIIHWDAGKNSYVMLFERTLFSAHGKNGRDKSLLTRMMNSAEDYECESCGTTNLMKSSVNRCCIKGFIADYRGGGLEDEIELRSFAIMGLDALEFHLDVLRAMDNRQERVRGIQKVKNSFPFRLVENLREVLPAAVKHRICQIEATLFDKYTAHAPPTTPPDPDGFFKRMFNMVKDGVSYYSTRLTEMAPQIVNKMFDFVKVTFSFISEGLVRIFDRVKEALTRLLTYIMSPFEMARDLAKGTFDRVIKTCLLILLLFLCSIGLFSFTFGYLLGKSFANTVPTTFVAHAPQDVVGAALGITAFCVGGCSRGMNKELGQKARTLVALVAGGAILSQFVKALIYLLPTTIQVAATRKWGSKEKNAELDANEWIPRATALCKVSLIPEMLCSKYYYDQLQKAANDMDKFISDLPMAKRGEVLSLYGTIMKKLMICYRVQGVEVKRRIPFSFHIAGPPGVGKSLMLTHLLHDVFEKRLGDVYQRSVSSEYWDRYALEPIVVYDEFLIGNSSTEFNQTIAREYLNLVSPTRFQPPMASVDDPVVGVKGTEARPIVVATLNNTAYNSPTHVDRVAFQRRRRFVVEMKLRTDARMMKGSSNVDLSKYTVEEIAGIAWAAFRILPGEHCSVRATGGNWYNYEELVEYIKHDYESHSEICDLLETGSDARSDLPSPEEVLNNALKNTNFIPTEDVGVTDAVLMWMSGVVMGGACANGSRGRRRKREREARRAAGKATDNGSSAEETESVSSGENGYKTPDQHEEISDILKGDSGEEIFEKLKSQFPGIPDKYIRKQGEEIVKRFESSRDFSPPPKGAFQLLEGETKEQYLKRLRQSFRDSPDESMRKEGERICRRFESLRNRDLLPGYDAQVDLPPPKPQDPDDNTTPPPVAKDYVYDFDHECMSGASNIVVVDGMLHRHPCVNKKYGCQRNTISRSLKKEDCMKRCSDCVSGHVENNVDYLTYEYASAYAPSGEIVWGRGEGESRVDFLKRLRDHYSVPVNMARARADAIFCDMLYQLELTSNETFSEFASNLISGSVLSLAKGFVTGLTISLGLLFISWCIRWFMGNKEESLAADFTACGATGASLKTSKTPRAKRSGRRMNFTRGKTHKGFTAHSGEIPQVTIENVTTGHTVMGLPVKGHWIITYSHLWLCLFSDGDKLKIRFGDKVTEETYVEDNMVADEDEDVLLYRIESKKHEQFADFTKKFLTRVEMEEFKNCSVHVKLRGYTQYAHCMKSVDIAYAHQGYRFNPQNVVHISASSQKGDCGRAVIAVNGTSAGKVLGVVVAGATDGAPQCIAVLYNIDDIMHVLEPGKEVYEGDIGEACVPTPDTVFEAHSMDCMDCFFGNKEEIEYPNLTTVTMLPMSEIVHQPRKSKLKLSALAEHLPWESTKQPAVMSRDDPRSEFDPVVTSLKNCFNVRQVELDESLVEEVFKDLKFNYNRDLSWPIGKRNLTFEEACGGIPGKLASLNVNTSCGYPKVHFRKQKGKKDFFWFDEKGKLGYDEGFKEEVLNFVSVWQSGGEMCHRWVGYFKDELVSMKKIEEARTRVIYCGDVTGVVALRMLYGSLLCAVSESVNKIPMAIGMNQYSYDMEKVHRYLTRLGGKKFVAGDYKAFDQHYQKAFQVAAFDLVHELVYGEEKRELLRVMKAHQIDSWAQLDTYEFKAKCYHYSGCLFTAIVNCFVNEAYFRYLFKKHFEGQCFDECCSIKTLGDDHVLCMNDNIEWTGPQIQKHMEEVGQVYTNVDKENPVIPDCVTFEETTFLGAHPVRVLGVYSGALRKETLFLCPMWTRNDNLTLVEEMKAMCEFASQWPEEFYLWYTTVLTEAAQKAGIPFPQVNPWSDERRRVAGRTAASEKDFKIYAGFGNEEEGLTKLVTSDAETVTAKGLEETDLLHLSSPPSMSLQYGTKSLIRRGSFVWTTGMGGGTTLVNVSMPNEALILGSPDNLQNMPFYSFLYWRGCVEITMQINGTPFQSGALIAYVNPLIDDDRTWIAYTTTMQHVIMQPNGNTTASITVPFNFPFKRLNTTHDAWPRGEMFRFMVKVLSPLRTGTNGSESATVTLFTRFPDSEFALPKALTATEVTRQKILRELCSDGKTLPLINPGKRLDELVQEYKKKHPVANKFKKRAEIVLKGDVGVSSKWEAHGQSTSVLNYYKDIAGSVSAEVRQTPTQDISPGLSASYGGNASTGAGHPKGAAGSSVDSGGGGSTSGGLSFFKGSPSRGSVSTIGTGSNVGVGGGSAISARKNKSVPMDNPVIGGNSISVAPKYPSLSKSEGLEPTNVLALKPNELQRHHEAQIGEIGDDRIESLCRRVSRIVDLTWDGNDAADSALWTFPLNSVLGEPMVMGETTIPFCLAIINQFVYFHCDFVFDIMVFRTGFHSGRLKFVVGYGTDELPILDDQGYFQEILDFNEDHYTHRVIVPWNYALQYALTYKGAGNDFFTQTLGYGSLKVLNVLKNPDSVNDSVNVQVFLSAQNVHVAVPHPCPLAFFKSPALVDNTAEIDVHPFKLWTPPSSTRFEAHGEDTPDAVVHKKAESLEGVVGGAAVSVTERLNEEKPREPCETKLFAKFPHEVVSIYELLRRYQECEIGTGSDFHRWVKHVTYEYKEASNGVTKKIKYLAMVPYLPYPWNFFFRMHAGSVKFRIYCHVDAIQSIMFFPEGDLDFHNLDSLNRMAVRTGARHDLAMPTEGTAGSLGYYPGLQTHNPWGHSWGYPAMEVMYYQSNANWIDFTVPFYSQKDRLATCWGKPFDDTAVGPFIGEGKGLVLVQFTNDSWSSRDVRVFMKVADDYRVSVFGAPQNCYFGYDLGGARQASALSGFSDGPAPATEFEDNQAEESDGDDSDY